MAPRKWNVRCNYLCIMAETNETTEEKKAGTKGGGSLILVVVVMIVTVLGSVAGAIFWLTKLTFDLFKILGQPFSGKDLVMIAGGLFLIWKSVREIHGNVEGEEHDDHASGRRVGFAGVIVQIVLFDIVFSLDSVITAVGMAQQISVMIAAVVLAMILMMFASGAIGGFVNRHPTIKMLALAFLLLIGVVLVADGFRQHVSKAYIYFAMAFSFIVELLNLRMRSRRRKLAAKADARD